MKDGDTLVNSVARFSKRHTEKDTMNRNTEVCIPIDVRNVVKGLMKNLCTETRMFTQLLTKYFLADLKEISVWDWY